MRSVGRFLWDNFGILAAGICTAGVAVVSFVGLHEKVDVLYTTAPGLVVSGLTIVAIIGYFVQLVQQTSRAVLARKLRETEAKAAALKVRLDGRYQAAAECFREHLALISKRLNFTASERISVYKFRHDDGRFRIVGRYATNGNLDNARRQVHDAGQGLVSQTYQSQQVSWYDCVHDPAGDYERYCEEHYERFDVPIATARSFRMRSRSYYGYPVLDAPKTRCIAVLICESTDLGRMTRLDDRFKIKSILDEFEDSIRIFVETADPGDDYLLQSQRTS